MRVWLLRYRTATRYASPRIELEYYESVLPSSAGYRRLDVQKLRALPTDGIGTPNKPDGLFEGCDSTSRPFPSRPHTSDVETSETMGGEGLAM